MERSIERLPGNLYLCRSAIRTPMMSAAMSRSPRTRTLRTLRGMARLVCPSGDPGLPDAVAARAHRTLALLPPEVRRVVTLALFAIEFGSLWPRHGGVRFTRLAEEQARGYLEAWRTTRAPLLRQLVNDITGLIVMALYDQPAVKDQLGFRPQQWITDQSRRRLERWPREIELHQELLRSPAPLVQAEPAPRPTPRRAGGIHTRQDFAGGILDCDAVIVGSGAGGAVMAAELAEGGLSVIVLEEGGHHPTEEFSSDASEMIPKLYRDGGASLALGSPSIRFSEGRCVGGSTVINGGMSWRTPDRVLERWNRVDGVDGLRPQEVQPYFERVERFLSAAPQDPGSIGRDQELFHHGAERLGWRILPNIRAQVHCAGCNACITGCPTGAKQSTLVSYLPRAAAFGANTYADCRAERVHFRGSRAVGLSGHVLLEDGQRGPSFTVRARLVVVCGGAVQTPALLLRSGVRSASGQLGRNLALHPTAAVSGVFDEQVEGWKGVHQAYQVREFQDDGLILVAVNLPPSLLAFSLRHFEADEMTRVLVDYNRILTTGVLMEDTSRGTVRLLPGGRPAVFYQLSGADAARLVRGVALLAELLFAAGASRVLLPFDHPRELRHRDEIGTLLGGRVDTKRMDVSTVHLMGTARMGSDPRRHVCDSDGRVYGREGLYVADASLFPTPIGVNPMETIMALATRNAERILSPMQRGS